MCGQTDTSVSIITPSSLNVLSSILRPRMDHRKVPLPLPFPPGGRYFYVHKATKMCRERERCRDEQRCPAEPERFNKH